MRLIPVGARRRSTVAVTAVLGLVAAGVVTSAPAAEAVPTSRIAGSDRFATSVEISRQTPFTGDVVYLASGLSFPDALAAGPVAAAEGGHLLLTRPDAVDAAVMGRIAELAPSEIVLVGSASTVRESVRAQLAQAFPGTSIERIGGTDRVGTSLLLLDRLAESGGVSEVWVVSGWNFPDALVAASVAGATGGAIVLDWHGTDAASVRGWADRIEPYVSGMPVSIAGGTPSVSAADEALLGELGAVDIVRHAGTDRYDTARLINDAYEVDANVRSMLLATGENFPDALAGAVQAASTGMPLYLSPGLCHPTITPMLASEAVERDIIDVIGLGSAASVSDLALSLGTCPAPDATQRLFAAEYGVFDPIRVSGSGSGMVAMPPHARVGVVEVDNSRSTGSLRAWTVAADGNPIELVASPSGPARSFVEPHSRPFGLGGGPTPTHLYIETSGPWTVEVYDMRSVPVGTTIFPGHGDAVWLAAGGAPQVHYFYAGGSPEGGFEAWSHRPASLGGGSTLIASSAGATNGTVAVPGTRALVTVRASGQWTLRQR
ncbi:putative cell wall-binding protein [Agrococcus sp. UYP10]|uniref:cell wall-binding repeat-containing protein n=1 Tax=Agrococcus sp. UYP10 TaxID=1756355 RepID=UPI003398F87F